MDFIEECINDWKTWRNTKRNSNTQLKILVTENKRN